MAEQGEHWASWHCSRWRWAKWHCARRGGPEVRDRGAVRVVGSYFSGNTSPQPPCLADQQNWVLLSIVWVVPPTS